MKRWTKTPGKPSEETYECTPYETEVVQTTPDMTEAAKQLRHAVARPLMLDLLRSRFSHGFVDA